MSGELKLHDYQEVALEFMRARKHAGLFLDMGLGKTAVSLRALTPEHLPALVIAPKRVAEYTWEPEVAKWRPDLTVAVAKGTPAKRRAALEAGADIVVISRDNMADAEPMAKKFQTMIIDELSGFKTRGSKRWNCARRLRRVIPRVWGLTGTPSPNGLLDLWAQVFILDGGDALGTTLGGFRNRYFYPAKRIDNGQVVEWGEHPGSSARIHRLLEPLCLSMTTEGRVDLPPVIYNRVEVHLPGPAMAIYKQMKKDLVVVAELLGNVEHSAVNAAVLSNKLSQITAGALYPDERLPGDTAYTQLHTEKAKAVREIVEGTGSPVLVVYRFKSELDALKAELKGLVHTMDEPNIVSRWNAGKIPVLLAHPASAGMGLNLQDGGHTMVWTSLTWSLEEYQQMNKRLARQGQKNSVVIHHLLVPGTVDGAILDRLEGKKSVQDALMDHLESPI